MYANQASLLKIRFIMFCVEDPYPVLSKVTLKQLHERSLPLTYDNTDRITAGTNSFHWTRKFWQQGPRLTKSLNITLNLSKLPRMIAKVSHQILLGIDVDTTTTEPICIDNDVTSALGVRHNRNKRMLESIFASKNRSANVEAPAVPLESFARFKPALESYVSLIDLSQDTALNSLGSNPTTLKIMGDIVNRYVSNNEYEQIAESMQHLSICFSSVLTMSVSESLCYEMSQFNYYSHLLLNIDTPVHHAHMWLQTSPDTIQSHTKRRAGRLKGSDTYIMIDTRLGSDGGLFIHQEAVGTILPIPMKLLARIREHVPDFPPQHYLSTPYSLQRYTADVCSLVKMSEVECVYAAETLTRAAYQGLLAVRGGLPSVQVLPTPAQPFVFLHIEKTAGTTLRE